MRAASTFPSEGLVRTYFERWNAQDGAGVAALFTAEATYEDPATARRLAHGEIAAMVARIGAALSPTFEVLRAVEAGASVVIEWRVRGRNTGPYRPGFQPSQRPFELQGVDVLDVLDGQIRSARRYFDQKELAERIGLQVIVEPFEQDGADFGYSMHVASGYKDPPGLIALTWIRARDEAEKDRIRGHSRQIIRDFRGTEGFVGIVTGFAGLRGFTVTAWQDEQALARGLAHQHATAKHAFRTTDISPGVWTSVWKPERINRIWTRCPSCTSPNDVTDDHRTCRSCGAELPPRPSFW